MFLATWLRNWKRSIERRGALRQNLRRGPGAFRPRLEALEERQLLSAYVVTSTADDGGAGELRAAINAVNAGTNNEIDFNISGSGLQTIYLASALPGISKSVYVNGLSQGGSGNTVPLIEVNGVNAGTSADGLLLNASNCTVSGLIVAQFSKNAIEVHASNNTIGGTAAGAGDVIINNGPYVSASSPGYGLVIDSGVSGTTVQGNFIGTDPSGNFSEGNPDGIVVNGSNNTIGGTIAGARNVISGNGINVVINAGVTGVAVQGNYIGIDPTSAYAIYNYGGGNDDGIDVFGNNNTIGGTAAAARNVISGNNGDGIFLDVQVSGIVVQGNYVGTDATGSNAITNGKGIVVQDANNVIGGTAAGAGNLISGNYNGAGVVVAASGVQLQGNLIGVNAADSATLANSIGIEVTASKNTIGGTSAALANVISGNTTGILIDSGVSGVVVQGQFIGTDLTGTSALANNRGVEVAGSNNTIGGMTAGASNVISSNSNDGVLIDSGVTGVLVAGNKIGTDITGQNSLGNGTGVEIAGTNNTVGGTTTAARNVISANGSNGVLIDSGATGNLLQGNYVGTNVDGNTGLANYYGIQVNGSSNTIGGTVAAARNLISNNSSDGVLFNSGANSNLLEGNYVGTDVTGSSSLTNTGNGVEIASNNNTIGGTVAGARNVISANYFQEVLIDSTGSGNQLQGNYIGTDATGENALGSTYRGVEVQGSNNTIGGTATAARNVISGNDGGGILIDSVSGILVQGNYVGLDATGANAVGNSGFGIVVYGNKNTIGGTVSGARNFISANTGDGIDYYGSGALIQGDYVGVNAAGSAALGNSGNGVYVTGNNPTIGGTAFAARNVISGNSGVGVYISGSGGVVQGNFVGVNSGGTVALGNSGDGIDIAAHNNTVGGTASGARNVISANGGYGVNVSNVSGVQIQGNYVGTDYTATHALGNTNAGVIVQGSQNTVGGTAAAARNVVSANGQQGIVIEASGVVVQGNYVGTNVSGSAALGNGTNGVEIDAGKNTLGGTAAGARNLISGNVGDGVLVNSSSVQVVGNFIGTNAGGSAALGNGNGIEVDNYTVTIGGTTSAARNLISGNTGDGVLIDGGATGVLVQGDYVGTDVNGTKALANSNGVYVNNAYNNTIGGTNTAARDVISGNSNDGVLINGTGNVLQGDLIGTTYVGNAALGNSNGVEIAYFSNTIGGTAAGARNIISSNRGDGVLIDNNDGTNVVQGNFIGVNLTSSAALANSGNGIEDGGYSNTLGGTVGSARNVIAGNGGDGILLNNASSSNVVQGNFLGLGSNGATAFGNSGNGIEDDGQYNTIGGTATGARNIISANGKDGILYDSGDYYGQVLNNFIGTDSTGKIALGNANGIEDGGYGNTIGGTATAAHNVIAANSGDGILYDSTAISGVAENNFVGLNAAGTGALANGSGVVLLGNNLTLGSTLSAARNVISGNTGDGVELGGSSNTVLGNYVGTNNAGGGAVANSVGIEVTGTSDTIGGTVAGARNIVSGNTTDGILFDSSATGNAVQGNYVGANYTGAVALANGSNGIELQGDGNTIGGTVTAARNILSGNAMDGIMIDNGVSGNTVQGNFIGVNLAGSAALANGTNGIEDGGTGNTLGGTASGTRNIISGNANDGVLYDSTATGEQVVGNFIGTDSSGAKALGNLGNGVEDDGINNTIGGTVGGSRNIISANSKAGVLYGTTSNSGSLQGNFIGTDISGNKALANGSGVEIAGANNTVGGTTSAARNVISGNTNNGVLFDSTATGNAVQSNYVGTDHTGAAALSNGGFGVSLAGSNNSVGAAAAAASNTLAFNKQGGINVTGGSGNSFRWNAMFANGATQTGPGITETVGANNGIAPPTITSATYVGPTLTVKGTFTAPTGGVAYVLDFYANPTGDAEGKVYLGKLTVTPSSAGTVSFTYTTTTSIVGTDPVITSTLTDNVGDTSAFSNGATA